MKQYRYTGTFPPPEVLDEFPNWMLALDEEGEDGQDETTLKPDEEQSVIGEETSSTAADATFPDGTLCPAILSAMIGLNIGDVEFLDVIENHQSWQVDIAEHSWEPSEFVDSVDFGDSRIFPLKISSRLPSENGKPISFILMGDGTIK